MLAALIYALAFSPWGAATQTGTERTTGRRTNRETLMHWTAALSFSLTTAYVYRWLRWTAAEQARGRRRGGSSLRALRRERASYDAIVVGSGPNGLAAAIVLARAGRSVLVREAASTPGGGVRSEALTLPGFVHDVCSAVHPLGIASPLFRRLPLAAHGLQWVQPNTPLAHPFDDGTAALLERSTEATGATLGPDAAAWRRLMDPFVARWQAVVPDVLGPLRPPRHPLLLARFGMLALLPDHRARAARASGARRHGHSSPGSPARDPAAHPPPSAAFRADPGIAGHAVGWPFVRGGPAARGALVSYLRSLGGEIETDALVESVDDLPPSRAVLLD